MSGGGEYTAREDIRSFRVGETVWQEGMAKDIWVEGLWALLPTFHGFLCRAARVS